MTYIKRAIQFVSLWLNWIAGLFVVLLMFLSFMDVFLRYTFNMPISGTYEISGLMALVFISLSLAQTQAEDGHIRVDILNHVLSGKKERILRLFSHLVCFIMSSIASWQSFLYARSLAEVGEASQTEKIPFAPFAYIAAAGFLILCLVLVVNFFDTLMGAKKK